MSEERNPWEQMIEEGESAKWFSRFNKFRMMKPWERSVNAVFVVEQVVEQSKSKKKQEKTRTNPGKAWYAAASDWKWEERAAAWDKSQLDKRDKQIAEEEADVWRRGLAIKHERVKELEEKARLIEASWHDPVEKEKIIFQWLTPDKIREWRGCLDDIAKIKGEHIKKQEITGKDGAPLAGGVGFYKAVELPQKQSLIKQEGGDANVNSDG